MAFSRKALGLATGIVMLLILVSRAEAKSNRSAKKSPTESKYFCVGCTFVVEELAAELEKDKYAYRRASHRMEKNAKKVDYVKTEGRILDTLEDICPRIDSNWAVVTSEDGKKRARSLNGNVSGSLDSSPQVSKDLARVCNYIADKYESQIVQAFHSGLSTEEAVEKVCFEAAKACPEAPSEETPPQEIPSTESEPREL